MKETQAEHNEKLEEIELKAKLEAEKVKGNLINAKQRKNWK